MACRQFDAGPPSSMGIDGMGRHDTDCVRQRFRRRQRWWRSELAAETHVGLRRLHDDGHDASRQQPLISRPIFTPVARYRLKA